MSTHELENKLQQYLGYLSQDNNNLNLLLSIGNCYRQLGDWEFAQRYLDEAKKIAEKPFWTEQGILYLESNQFSLAKDAFTHALNEMDTQAHRLNLGFCLYLNQEFEAALVALDYPNDKQPLHEAAILMAKILHHIQRPDEAIILLEQLIIENPANDEIAGLLALLHFDDNNIEQAELFSARALFQNEINSSGQLVQVLLKTLRREVSLPELERLLIANPNECRLWYALGTTQMQHMNVTAAEEAFAQAIQIWPNFYDCFISIGWCHILQNKLDKAEDAYNEAVTIDAEGADGWGGLALVHALRNEKEMAQNLLDKALLLDSDCFQAKITQIIMANHVDPKQAAKLLSETLPAVALEMEHILNQFTPFSNGDIRILH